MSSTAEELSPRAALGLLAEAGAVLASSLDFATTLHQVAGLTVPELAQLCVVDVLQEDGSVRDAAVAAASPEVAVELEDLRARFPLDREGPHPVARVLRSGRAEILAGMTDQMLAEFAEGSEHERFMVRHSYRSAVVLPLSARGRTIGAFSLLRFAGEPPFGQADVELAQELARRAALALANARLFTELARTEQRLEAILANLAEAVVVNGRDGRVVYANRAAVSLLGARSAEEVIGAAPGTLAARFLTVDEAGRRLSAEDMPGRRVLAGGEPAALLTRSVERATGVERWLITKASALRDSDSGEAVLAVSVIEDVTDVKRAQLAEHVLAGASSVLASSHDYRRGLVEMARVAVPALADWCAIDLLAGDGQIETVAVQHSDPARAELARELRERYPRRADDAAGAAAVIRERRSALLTEVPDELLAHAARDAEHLRLLRELAPRSALIVPMLAGERVTGAITLANAESGRRLSERDVGLAQELGRRAGHAVETVRLAEERRQIADTLQRALRPDRLASPASCQSAARYLPAGELNEVGGDFFDLFPRGPDAWGLVIGDVCGKGAHAAAVTALARYTLRAVAMQPGAPHAILQTLNTAMLQQLERSELCTACFAAIAPRDDSLSVTLALGGHPPPIVIDRDGNTTEVGEPGTLLGVFETIDVHDVTVELVAGETLLFYTDGLTDAGGPHHALREHGLAALLRAHAGEPLERLLAALERAAIERSGGRPRDDIAIIALRAGAP